jgi:hypothetical protein
MSEIITPIIEDGNGGFYISKKHTIADIYRWVVEHDYWPEMLSLYEIETREVKEKPTKEQNNDRI